MALPIGKISIHAHTQTLYKHATKVFPWISILHCNCGSFVTQKYYHMRHCNNCGINNAVNIYLNSTYTFYVLSLHLYALNLYAYSKCSAHV